MPEDFLKMQWFGKDWGAPILAELDHQPTPISEFCLFCEERILEQDDGFLIFDGEKGRRRPVHWECNLRQVVGSVGHLTGKCSCHGGTDGDPPGMTRREAAKAAVALWERNFRAGLLYNHQNKGKMP